MLGKILEGINFELIKGDLNVDINKIEEDSRRIEKGDAFIAIKGFEVDGHKFIDQAIKKGAKVIIYEEDVSDFTEGISYVKVSDTRKYLAKISSNYYNNPDKKMELVGVTGTNGKTSITYMLKSILEVRNKKVGLMGTIGSIIDNEFIENKNTTPGSLEVNRQMDSMLRAKSNYCLMEVSSHALSMHRVRGLDFNVGIFTNLTEEHLDYHKDMEDYFNEKLKLFYMTKDLNIINSDDAYGKKIIDKIKSDNLESNLSTYGLSNNSDLYASNIDLHSEGVNFTLNYKGDSIDLNLNLLGEFNIYNSLAAAACALYYGYSLEEIKEGLEAVNCIDGRFNRLDIEDYNVIIDFAHSPDGLKQVLKTIDDFAEGRKIVVFGAGGNRDRRKRPLMGETVAKYGDISIITSDNPRYEDPVQIIDDIEIGTKRISDNYKKIVDRREAIEYALRIAEKNDVVLIAGKGHEKNILINGKVIPFDEEEIVFEILNEIKGEKDA